MKTEWTFGGVVAVAVGAGLLLWIGVFAVLGSCGCKGVDPNQIAERIQDELPDNPSDTPAVAVDALNASEITSYKCAKEDWRKWPVTQSLSVKLSGNKALLTTDAVKVWKDGGGDVCASFHFIVKRDGQWRAYCFDYVRPGQTTKDKSPPRPPCKEGEDYETVSKDEECYLVLTGLVRDHRRNVRERTNIVRVQ